MRSPVRFMNTIARGVLVAALAAVVTGCVSARRAAPEPAEAAMGMRNTALPELIYDVAVRERPWRFAGHDGRVLITPHYRLHTTVGSRAFVDRLPLFLERAMAQYTGALVRLPAPEARLETYLLDTRNQWEAKTRQVLPDQAATFLTLGRGGFTTRGVSVLYYIGAGDTLSIAAHEGWHQFSQRTLRSQLPLWLEEGIATYMEGYVTHPDGLPKFRPWANRERYQTLRDAVRADRLIPLPELLAHSPQTFLETGKSRLLVYYAQVWALTLFLAEGEQGRYLDGLQQVLLDAAQGRLVSRSLAMTRRRGGPSSVRLGPTVLEAYFDRDLDGFQETYLAFIDSVVRTGGLDRVVQGRSPVAESRPVPQLPAPVP